MGGWKTWTGAIGMILSGAGLVVAGITTSPVNGEKIAQGLGLIMAGLAMVGIGYKVEKTKNKP